MPALTAILRNHSLLLFQAGIAAADPETAVRNCLRANKQTLSIRLNPDGADEQRTGNWSKIHLLAFGKAACRMARAARESIPENPLGDPGIVVTNYDNQMPLASFSVYGAGHPLPDENGLLAAQHLASRVDAAGAGELLLILISGGGSALLPLPVAGVSLADKIATTQQLLRSGASIHELNCVRKHLSQIKGGGLTRRAAPADLHALILSDVLDDDLSVIASGPTVADDTTYQDAIDICQRHAIWQELPASVMNHLAEGAQGRQMETLKSCDPLLGHATHTLIGSNTISVDALIETAQTLGYQTEVFSRHLAGEARLAAEQLAEYCKNALTAKPRQSMAIIAGGETTVTVSGTGQGGRNQEMALAFALAAERLQLNANWTFLSGGTDGRDGPTDAAGGLVNSQSLRRMREAGLDPQAALTDNDSYTALRAADALVITGATGTNVADLQIVLLHPSTE